MSAALGCSLLVAAASDLSHLEKPLASSIPQCSIRFTFGASGMLAEQIRHGADYDVFLSANEAYVDQTRSRIAGLTPQPKLGTLRDESRFGHPSNSPGKTNKHQSAGNRKPSTRPVWVGCQAGTRPRRLVDLTPKPHRLRRKRSPNASVCIDSECRCSDRSLVSCKRYGGQLIPAEWHQPIIQAGVVPNRSRNPAAAKELLRFLLSADGQKLLSEFGFSPVTPIPQSQSASPAR